MNKFLISNNYLYLVNIFICKLFKILNLINGFDNFSERFEKICSSKEWNLCQEDFNLSDRIYTVGNGGNLAVCDHGAIDISRLSNKSAKAPGSGILASSLINDASHDLWVKNWISIEIRGLDKFNLSKSMIIGISSSGYSKNICTALDYAVQKGIKAWLISAQEPKIKGSYKIIKLNVNEYHTSEVLALSLFYQLIHGAGFICPSITDSVRDKVVSDYKQN